jgi:hypothetical protein
MNFLGRFNSAGKTRFFEFTYMVTIALLLAAAVFTPVIIRHHLLLIKKYVIQEDAGEVVLISILLLTAYLLSNAYKKELKKYRQESRRLAQGNSDLSSKLTDAFKYIGGVNVQIQEIRSIFCGLRRYPATENEFRKVLALFARKVLGIVNADWVMIRIICQANLRTLKEHLEGRNNANFISKGISNKAIVANRSIDGYSIVASRHDNSVIMSVCIFPKNGLDEEEKILIEAITHQIEMLYLIFLSRQPYRIYPNRKPFRRNLEKAADNVKREASL